MKNPAIGKSAKRMSAIILEKVVTVVKDLGNLADDFLAIYLVFQIY